MYCLSGLGIVRKNRRMSKYFLNRSCLFQDEPIVMILTSVISLRSFNHEFTRFEKKHYPWSDLIDKNIPTPELIILKAIKLLSEWCFILNLRCLNRPPSRKSRSGGTSVTVVGRGNMTTGLRWSRHFRYMDFMTAHKKSPGKIKITIIKIAVPGNRDQ